VHWTARTLPSVIVLTTAGEDIADPRFRIAFPSLSSVRTIGMPEHILQLGPSAFRVHLGNRHGNPPAVLLPLDKLFDIRAAAALRLWRTLAKRSPGPNPAALSPQRRKRLVLALRALDGRQQRFSYHAIADTLLHLQPMPDAEWQTHELRSYTIRLCETGEQLMNGGYRNLLLYPYRRLP
jgi:hypothetical protein